jgi:cytochrome c biogenesis protein CcdA
MELTLSTVLPSGVAQAVLLGGGFGLLHAFDADHMATLGGLAVGNRSLTPRGYALRWALGHAAALGAIALAVLGLGATGLVEWTSYAEFLVCLALLLIGGNALRAVWQRRTTTAPSFPSAHSHGDGGLHVHFSAPFHAHARSGRTGLFLGVLHGGAGSAAVLALLPLAHFQNGIESAIYLVFFSLGVAAGALAFATAFAAFSRRALAAGERLSSAFQAAIGVLAIASGTWLFVEIMHGRG